MYLLSIVLIVAIVGVVVIIGNPHNESIVGSAGFFRQPYDCNDFDSEDRYTQETLHIQGVDRPDFAWNLADTCIDSNGRRATSGNELVQFDCTDSQANNLRDLLTRVLVKSDPISCTCNNGACEQLPPPPPDPFCGDNEVNQPSEECDGTDVDGETCQTQGYHAGTLGCDESCTFDTSQCINNPPPPPPPVDSCDGANKYVDKDETVPGFSGTVYTTIQDAVSSAQPGDHICIAADTYYEHVFIGKSGTENSRIVIEGEDGVVIDGGSRVPKDWQPAQRIDLDGDIIPGTEIPGAYMRQFEPEEILNNSWSFYVDPYYVGLKVDGEFKDVFRYNHFNGRADDDEFYETMENGPYHSNTSCCQQVNKVRQWDGVEAMFGQRKIDTWNSMTYIHLPDNQNPNNSSVEIAFGSRYGATVYIDASYITLRNIKAINAQHALRIGKNDLRPAHHNIIEDNVFWHGDEVVTLHNQTHHNIIRNNEITQNALTGWDASESHHPFKWNVIKSGTGGEGGNNVGLAMRDAGAHNEIYGNHIHGIFDGISTNGVKTPTFDAKVKIRNNLIENAGGEGIRIASQSGEYYENTIRNVNTGVRFSGPRSNSLGPYPVYFYKNNITTARGSPMKSKCTWIHIGQDTPVYYYHNTCSMEDGHNGNNGPQYSVPNYWFINNVFSADDDSIRGTLETDHIDYNWYSGDGDFHFNQVRNNIIESGDGIWDPDELVEDFTLPSGHEGKNSAINLNQVNHLSHGDIGPLPGMNNYYVGTPDMGSVQD